MQMLIIFQEKQNSQMIHTLFHGQSHQQYTHIPQYKSTAMLEYPVLLNSKYEQNAFHLKQKRCTLHAI